MEPQAPTGPWVYLVPLLAVLLILLRNRRERRLRIEWLWVSPVVLIALTALVFSIQPPPGPVALALDVAGFGLGVLAGWWRGRLTRISVEPRTQRLAAKASPLGMALILALFAVRYGLRSLDAQAAGALHVSALEVTDALMLMAVGLVSAQRLEIALRASRLRRDARGG